MATKAMGSKKYLQLLLFQVALLGPVFCGNMLVWPTEGSHWLNVKIIIEELIRRGHSITILVSNASLFIKPRAEATENFVVYNVPFKKDTIENLIEDVVALWLNNRPTTLTFWQFYKELGKLSKNWHQMNRLMCDAVLTNRELMAHLQGSGYDLLLSDPVTLCGDLLALKLAIPFIYSLRFSPASTVERHCGKIPAPPSYTPAALSELTDCMSFGERIKNIVSYHLQDYVFQSYWGEWDIYYSKVVVWPTDASHWINVKVLLEELVLRGHEVTVLVPSSNLLIDYRDTSSPFTFEVLQVPFTQESLDAIMEDFLNFWINEISNLTPWEIMWRMKKDLEVFTNMSKQTCDTLVTKPQLIAKLWEAKFDILIADPLCVGGELIAEILAIPFVYSFRFSDGNVVERLCGGLLSPPSYVPASTMRLTDQMSFVERLKNFLFYFYMDLFFLKFWQNEWDRYYSNVLGRPTTLCETMGKAEIWLIRTYWDFEFPRPFLPNFEFVGGLHCQPAKPLPKVLWRYKGKKPETLGSNTRIYDWIPQNDLLGHPLTKAFITHGGTNGIYEAIYHGIPMIGIPMFADQHDNIAHMRAKGAATELDFSTLETQDLVDALNTVINNSTYKENALRLSKIHHDQPVKPLDRAVFWIEFVMRHKGAKHLRPAAHHLTWYQYHCLDVLAFLFTCTAIAVFILVKCCLFCCRRCGRIAKRKKE
ncbi:UDP-glucuronosyltransferase 2A1 isoform X2 [Falco peregrinus]|uniref:UDP-glucuronosyltransferase 2A1 isoform X2 n=1 Tax=Falco peregrinus TaxID=8954 RepID=UPI00247967D2|nr:UDP-glucuronosyltransferase 2A1 isoform X2 [Falco peregrinus]